MPIGIVPFEAAHLDDAATLLAARHRAGRERTPWLPAQYEDADSTAPILRNCMAAGPGAAAYRGSRMAGFLLSSISFFNGEWMAFSHDLAHAVDATDGRQTYRLMYARLSQRWVENGCFKHAISLPAGDAQAADAWHSLGFGLNVVDAVRDTSPVVGTSEDVDVRRAGPADLDTVMELVIGLRRHLASAPAFLPLVVEADPTKPHQARLADPTNALWLAYLDGEAVGLMSCSPPGDRPFPAALREDASTCNLGGAFGGAFIRSDVRGSGIGKALLNHVMSWARDGGYARCVLDYESANIEAERFWSGQGFEPIVNSLMRTIDSRIAWAHRDRADADLWRRW